jgi:hypothetical protein
LALEFDDVNQNKIFLRGTQSKKNPVLYAPLRPKVTETRNDKKGENMTYDHLIALLKQHQTLRIKAIAFPQSCTPNQIPDAFGQLLPDIIKLLEAHIEQFCGNEHVLVLFGLQPGSISFTSDYPVQLNRILDNQQPHIHLCCTLAYLTSPQHQLEQLQSWQGAQNIIIDFTTGTVMDGDRYFSQVFSEPLKGIVYGMLDNSKLASAWELVKNNRMCHAG